MSETLPNIDIQPTTWVDITAAVSMPVGYRIDVQNVGFAELQIAFAYVQPELSAPNQAFRILRRGDSVIVKEGDPPIWAYCQSQGGVVNIAFIPEQSLVDSMSMSVRILDDRLNEISQHLKLLNERFESAFETSISREDVEHVS